MEDLDNPLPDEQIYYLLFSFIVILLLGVLFSLLCVVYSSLTNKQKQFIIGDCTDIPPLHNDKYYLSLKFLKILFEAITIILGSKFMFYQYLVGGWNIELIFKLFSLLVAILVVFESIPRILINIYKIRSIGFFKKPLIVLTTILLPIIYVYSWCDKLLTHKSIEHKSNQDNVDNAILSNNDGDINLISGIDRFAKSQVEEIMTTRGDIVSLDINNTFQQVKELVKSSGYSRLPVHELQVDNIKGIIHVKDLIAHIDEKDFDWKTALREPYYVPENKLISELLQEFQSNRVHMAIVTDDYGSTQGIVTMEDILEEIVGEISDESDSEEKLYVKITPNEYIFDGKTYISDFQKILGLPDNYFDNLRGEAESLAGMMLEIKNGFPKVDEKLQILDFEFTALALSKRRIEKIKIISNIYNYES